MRSIRAKLTGFVVLLVALTTAALTVTGYSFVRDMLRDQVHEQLSLHSAGLREVLLAYVGQQHERVLLVASRTRLRELLRQRLDGEVESEAFLAQTRAILRDAQRSTQGFLAIRIADPDGRVITSTGASLLGVDVSHDAAYLAGREGATLGLPYAVEDGHQASLSAPARTNNGRALGVVLVELDVAPLRELLAAIRSGYETARVRLATREGNHIRYLFPSGSYSSTATVEPAVDIAMDRALNGETGFLDRHDREGREVLAAYRPSGYRDWALVADVDAAEAYAPIDRLRVLALAAAAVCFAIAGFGAWRIAGRFTQPISMLSGAAKAIEKGDLNVRAQSTTDDEVGELCHAFNHMAAGLKAHRDELEELVRARTSDLETRTTELMRSRDQLEGLVKLLEGQADVIQRDLHRAEVIQRSLLPHSPPSLPDFSVQTLYRPGRSVGGDLYDVVGIGERYVVLVIADASGHGVSAAMLSVLFKHRLRVIDEATGEPFRPGEALSGINTSLQESVSAPGVFVTAAYCLLDTVERELVVSSAGHPPLLWLKANGENRTIGATGPALGLYSPAEFAEHRCRLDEGDQLMLYTDGLLDNGGIGSMDTGRIADTLRSLSGQDTPLQKLFGVLTQGVVWEERDDATIVLLEARPGESRFDEPDDIEVEATVSAAPLELCYAELEEATLISIRGRATWTYADTLFEAAESVLEERRALIVDLSACDYLDSTFLGTLFQLVSQAETAGVKVSIQGTQPGVRALLEELSMHSVINHLTDDSVSQPAGMKRLVQSQSGSTQQQLRLLRAHELLSQLSDANREEFDTVVEAVRAEIGKV